MTSLEADLLYIPTSYPVLTPFTQVYQADLAKIGVTLNIKPMETATWLAQVNGVQYNGLYVSGDSLETTGRPRRWGPRPHGHRPRTTRATRPSVGAQLVEAVGTETDPAKQKELYGQVNDYMIDEAWSIVFAERAVIWLARSGVKNVNPTGRQSFLWHEVWLD